MLLDMGRQPHGVLAHQARGLIRQRMDEKNRERLVSFFLDDLSSKMKSN